MRKNREPYLSEVLTGYDFIKYVPCVRFEPECPGYLKPNGIPINDPTWGGGVKYPTQCPVCGIHPTISLSKIEDEGMQITWREIRALKDYLRFAVGDKV